MFSEEFPKSLVVRSSRVPPRVLQFNSEDEESEDGYKNNYLSEVGNKCFRFREAG